MWDTHCHLTDPRLFERLDAVLRHADSVGVSRIVTIGTSPPDWQAVLNLARDHPNVRCAIGVHPNNCHEVDLAQVQALRKLQSDSTVVALGEMGLDYHYEFAAKERQRSFFEAQLQLASELKRPVIIHCREAMEDCLAIMHAFSGIEAVFHCFTGSVEESKRVLDAGYLIGFTGVVTFRNAPELRQIAGMAPANRILVETDAPYLSPEPMRKQKVNEPAFVMHTAAAVAHARGISIADLDEITSENAARFYNWR